MVRNNYSITLLWVSCFGNNHQVYNICLLFLKRKNKHKYKIYKNTKNIIKHHKTVQSLLSLYIYIYIYTYTYKQSNGPKIEPHGTPASNDDQFEQWPLSTTLWNLLFKKLLRRLRRFANIPVYSGLNSNPSCHTLSNVLIYLGSLLSLQV